MRKVLITGGAGFIGSNLIESLIKGENYIIYVLDIKEEPKKLENVESKITYIHGDVRDRKLILDLFNTYHFDGVIHLAAISRVIWGEENPNLCVSTNVGGTRNIAEAMAIVKNRPWIIFGSSREVYGEPSSLPVSEKFPLKPINVYGRSKATGERIIGEFSEKYNINAIILRFSNVYGNEKDILDRVIPKFILRALDDKDLRINGGNQKFNFTFIDDTVNSIKLAMKYLDKKKYENAHVFDYFHILSGKPTSIVTLTEKIIEYTESKSKIVFTPRRNYDVDVFYGDPTKAIEKLKFKAKVDIDVGLKMTIKALEGIVK